MSDGFSKYTLLVILTIVVGFLITWDLSNRQAEKILQTGDEMNNLESIPENAGEVVIPVTGMSCQSCEMTIERALGELDGVYRVKADHEKSTVVAHYDPGKVSPSTMVDEIAKAGYTSGDPVEE